MTKEQQLNVKPHKVSFSKKATKFLDFILTTREIKPYPENQFFTAKKCEAIKGPGNRV